MNDWLELSLEDVILFRELLGQKYGNPYTSKHFDLVMALDEAIEHEINEGNYEDIKFQPGPGDFI